MRLTVSFVVLLVIATAAAGLLWGNVSEARAGDAEARVIASLAMPVALVAFVLLGRIVSKAGPLRRGGEDGR